MFDTYRRTFGRSPFIEDAEGMYAMCFYYLSPSPQRDQTVTGQAIVAISEFMSRYPDSEKYGQFEQMRKMMKQMPGMMGMGGKRGKKGRMRFPF